MTQKTVFRHDEGRVAILEINRPEVRNALDIETLRRLRGLVEQISAEAAVRVLVIRGGGGQAFSAGGDLKEMATFTPASSDRAMKVWQDALAAIERAPKPVIAAIEGFALGGGTELAMACHIRVATTNAKLGQPEILLDHLPGAGGTQRLPRLMPLGIALEYLLTGDTIPAPEAHRLGLVNHIWPPEEFWERTLELAERIAQRSPVAIEATLEAVREGLNGPLESGLRLERALSAIVLESDEAQKAFHEFMSRKKTKK